MIEKIKKRYGNRLQSAILTGDAMGKQRRIDMIDNSSLYMQLMKGLGMNIRQLKVMSNPTHSNSRNDLNYVLLYLEDFKINPETCPNTVRDMRQVQCDSSGSIIKTNRKDINQRSDFIDAVRYKVHNLHLEWILRNQKKRK